MIADILNKEDYYAILVNCYGKPEIEYVDSIITPLSENVEGFMGEHYKLKITYKLDNLMHTGNFFIKTKPTEIEIQKQMCDEFNIYGKETFLYDYILKEFSKRNFDVSFAPRCFLCKNQKTMVMEDLYSEGLILLKKRQMFDLSKCECLLKSLALFHAGGFMFEDQKSKELGRKYRITDDFGHLFKEALFSGNDLIIDFIKKVKLFSVYIIDRMPGDAEFKEDFKQRMKAVDVEKSFLENAKDPKTIGHGDLWSNNMMFQIKNGVATKCCLLDYQLLRYHHPAYDVMIAITETTNTSFRQKYMDYLIHYYYGCFSNQLKRHGYSADKFMSLSELLEGVKQAEFSARFQALLTHMLTFMPQSKMNSVVEGGNESMTEAFKGDNIQKYVDSYKTDEEYKEMVSDDLYDIYKSLKALKI